MSHFFDNRALFCDVCLGCLLSFTREVEHCLGTLAFVSPIHFFSSVTNRNFNNIVTRMAGVRFQILQNSCDSRKLSQLIQNRNSVPIHDGENPNLLVLVLLCGLNERIANSLVSATLSAAARLNCASWLVSATTSLSLRGA